MCPERDLLDGLIELDETFVGGSESGVDGHQTFHKAVVAIAAEILEPKGFGRVRLAHLRQVNATSIWYFATSAIEPAATIRTDGWNLYRARSGTY